MKFTAGQFKVQFTAGQCIAEQWEVKSISRQYLTAEQCEVKFTAEPCNSEQFKVMCSSP